ncbi:MAG TPA: hypothetical protein DCL61_06250 [Cyanobacteria bacterium UBA12227]|nr:hypothetical protein [Cyanobacteria bacterium UBA12227]HAX89699.1 hypothetical protein [Cyanobacteria bacterium UBA11370]HBY76736.1 hypothetical protein [Cyanobacteria bacterium UBA11148]
MVHASFLIRLGVVLTLTQLAWADENTLPREKLLITYAEGFDLAGILSHYPKTLGYLCLQQCAYPKGKAYTSPLPPQIQFVY